VGVAVQLTAHPAVKVVVKVAVPVVADTAVTALVPEVAC
jgi:hypothetical protein